MEEHIFFLTSEFVMDRKSLFLCQRRKRIRMFIWSEYNLSLHYIFELSHVVGVYPLTGINYAIENERYTISGHEDHRMDAFGLNIGAGVHFELKRWFPVVEYKYVISDLPQHALAIGALYFVGERKTEHVNHEPVYEYE